MNSVIGGFQVTEFYINCNYKISYFKAIVDFIRLSNIKGIAVLSSPGLN
jgi:hypothetical protein